MQKIPRRCKRSETDFLKLKKHDNPETNTEKFDIENYLNGNWDKIDKNVGEVSTNISNINSKNKEQDTNIEQLQENTETSNNKIEKLETELKEMQEDFYQNSIRGQASGEYIHVEDSSNCRAKIKISGNSEQETRSGKNILENSDNNVSQYGLTATIQNDGSVKISGTSTAETTKYLTNIKKVSVDLIKEGNYTISFKNSKNMNDVSIRLRKYNGTDKTEIKNIYLNAINKSEVLNLKSLIDTDTIEIELDVICYGNREYNFVLYPQLELGSETEYEQYGASPSPDYPSEVESCGDNINLFDKTDITENTSISVNDGTTYANNNSFSTNFIKIKGIKDICCNALSSDATLWGATYDENKNYIKGFTTTDGILSQTVCGATYVRLGILKKYLDTTKIEKGTISTSYSLHGQGCINEVICNKNMFDKNNDEIVKNSFINTEGNLGSSTAGSVSNFINCKENKEFVISRGVYNDYTNRVVFLGKNKNVLSSIENTSETYTFTTPQNTKYLRFQFPTSNIDTIQLEEGTTATAFEEHKSQTYTIPTQQAFKSIGNIRDTFIKIDDKWYERHYCNRYIFTGKETASLQNSGKRIYVKSADNNNILKPINPYNQPNKYKQLLCNYLEAVTPNDTWGGTQGISYDIWQSSGNEGFCITINEFTTVEQYLNFFKEKYDEGIPFYVDYILETPSDIECTEEQNKILDELTNARTYKNVTNITTDSKAILSLDYAKDLETLLNNTQALAVSNASEGV